MVIEFKDESMIQNWMNKSDELTAEAAREMSATAQLVQDIQQESEGTLVDELVTISNAVLTTAKALTGTMEEISSTIKNVVSKVAGFVDTVGGFLGGIGKSLLG